QGRALGSTRAKTARKPEDDRENQNMKSTHHVGGRCRPSDMNALRHSWVPPPDWSDHSDRSRHAVRRPRTAPNAGPDGRAEALRPTWSPRALAPVAPWPSRNL